MKTVVMNWNSRCLHTDWVQKPLQENKDTNGLAVTASYPQWVRNPFICLQQIPMQMSGHFLPEERYSPAFSNHQSGDLRDGHELPQLHTVKPDLWDPTTSYQAHPEMSESVTLPQGCWMDQWACQSCDLSHMYQFAPKDCGPCCSHTGFKWIQGVSYLASSQATEVKLTKDV